MGGGPGATLSPHYRYQPSVRMSYDMEPSFSVAQAGPQTGEETLSPGKGQKCAWKQTSLGHRQAGQGGCLLGTAAL